LDILSYLFIFVLTQKRTKKVKPWIFAGQIGSWILWRFFNCDYSKMFNYLRLSVVELSKLIKLNIYSSPFYWFLYSWCASQLLIHFLLVFVFVNV